MPLSKYDDLYGGNAEKAYRQMVARYGERKGRQVFYATANRRKRGKGGGARKAMRGEK